MILFRRQYNGYGYFDEMTPVSFRHWEGGDTDE